MLHCAYVYTYLWIVSVYMYMYILFSVNCGLPVSAYYSLVHIFSHLDIQRKVSSSPQLQPITTMLSINTALFTFYVTLYREPNTEFCKHMY